MNLKKTSLRKTNLRKTNLRKTNLKLFGEMLKRRKILTENLLLTTKEIGNIS
ncbi:MAG: pentapeptide repeat-containing protein [Minisyncoccia bacterium]